MNDERQRGSLGQPGRAASQGMQGQSDSHDSRGLGVHRVFSIGPCGRFFIRVPTRDDRGLLYSRWRTPLAKPAIAIHQSRGNASALPKSACGLPQRASPRWVCGGGLPHVITQEARSTCDQIAESVISCSVRSRYEPAFASMISSMRVDTGVTGAPVWLKNALIGGGIGALFGVFKSLGSAGKR